MRHTRLRAYGMGLTIAAVGLLAACQGKKTAPPEAVSSMDLEPAQVIGLGRIEPELRILDLQSEVSGLAAKVLVRAGDKVTKSQVLVELSSAIERAKLELKAAQVRAERSQIEAARAASASIRIKAENARLSFDRARSLYEQSAQAKAPFDAAKADYESLLQEIKRLDAGTAAAEDMLKQGEADLRLSQAELERRFLRAPTDGQVLSLEITPGSLVAPEKPVGTFAPESPLVARCEIDEMFAARVQPGQGADLRPPGMTSTLARGKVTFAGPALRKKSLFSDEVGSLEDRRVREVWITLDPGASLLFGTRVECVIRLKEK
jgi:HlyD family secretion protein